MADQLMDVISGASHGSYSFVHDNYIYRINKFTHKTAYLSCRLARCKGAGKGTKGATRGEIYGFQLSKPHNHPPEENKIKHLEVKEYVREEARCTTDSSKEIYERAVKLFDCYELSRACVEGLVKRSRERTTGEVAEKIAPRKSSEKNSADDDSEDEGIARRFILSEVGSGRKSFALMSAEEKEEDEQEPAAADYEEGYENVKPDGASEEAGDEQIIQVVIKREELEEHEVPVEYIQVDDGVDQDDFMVEDDENLTAEEESTSSDTYCDIDGSYREGSYCESESYSDVDSAVPKKRLEGNDSKPVNVPFRRLPEKRRHSHRSLNRARGLNLKRSRSRDSEPENPIIDQHLSIEQSLMKIFSSTYFTTKDNVFNLLNDPESLPDDVRNSLDSTNSLNIIKSASKLCTFAAVKASQMRNLLIGQTKELDDLEDVLLEHLSNLMCFSGTEFFQKCFGRSLQEAVDQGKRSDRKSKAVWNEEEIYSTLESKNDSMQLAVALLCYSGKAYLALSELIDLPGPTVARKWATNAEGNPGFSAQSFAAIRSEVSACRTKTISVCLSMEDVELRRHVDFGGGQVFGYTDLGYGRIESDSIPEATRAVVFYASAVNSHWRAPLGYCLADTLSPQVRSNLLSQYVSKLEFNGVKCVGIVLNNSAASTRIYEEFGVHSKGALPAGSLYTNADEKIRVSPFVDIIEAMESVKQLLREKQTFFTSSGDVISWSRLELTREFANSDNPEWGLIPGTYTLDFINSLKYLKTKILKDPWPFGRYFPEAMKILQKYGANPFKHWSPTIKFVQHMVEITEIFTTCNRFHEKSPCLTNDKNSLTSINKLIHYLEGLRFRSGAIVNDGDRRMPVMNLCMNLSSLKVVLRRVFDGNCGVFHRLTLSDVREFISEIRTDRELITPVQFRERYLKIVRNLDLSPTGTFISRHPVRGKTPEKFPIDSTVSTFKTYVYTPLRSTCDRLLDFFVDKIINVWLDGVDCPECFQVMLDSLRNGNSSLHRDLFLLVRRVETELSVMSEIPVDLTETKFPAFANKILNGLMSLGGFKAHGHFFVSCEFGGACHFTRFVKDFVGIYLRLRLPYLPREVQMVVSDFSESSMTFSLGQFWA